MRERLTGRPGSAWFVVADAAALIVFVILGLRGHRVSTVEGFARNAVPLLGAWFVVAGATGAYRRPGWRGLVKTWIVAVPIGLLVRTLIVGSPRGARIIVFIGVGLAFTIVLLVLGRLLVRSFARAR